MYDRPELNSSIETPDDEYVSFKHSLWVVRQRFLVIVLTAVLLSAATVGLSLLQTPQYEASIKVLVGQRGDGVDPSSLGSNVQGLQQLTLTLAEAAKNRPLAETVIQRLNLDVTPEEFIEQRLSVQPITDTQFIQISYKGSDRERVKQVANTIGEVFSNRVSEVSSDANAVTATVWEPAVMPDEPVSPDPLRRGLLALVLGTVLGLGLAFLLDYLDDSWRSQEEVEQVSGVPSFGLIPEFDVLNAKQLKRRKKSEE